MAGERAAGRTMGEKISIAQEERHGTRRAEIPGAVEFLENADVEERDEDATEAGTGLDAPAHRDHPLLLGTVLDRPADREPLVGVVEMAREEGVAREVDRRRGSAVVAAQETLLVDQQHRADGRQGGESRLDERL